MFNKAIETIKPDGYIIKENDIVQDLNGLN